MRIIKQIIKKIIHILNIILISSTIILSLISIFKKEWILNFIEWIKIVIDWLGNWNYFIAWFSSLIEAFPVLWIVVPWQNILLIVWGFFGKISSTNLIYVIIIASIWAVIWNYIWYVLWKYYGDDFFRKYWNWFGIWLTEVKYLKKGIDKWWPLWIIIGKFHPMTRAFLPFIAWSMGMHSTKFMIYNIIGSIIRAITIIILWVLFVAYYKAIIDNFGYIMLGIFVWIWWYIYYFKKDEFLIYMKEKNNELDELSKKK